MLNNWQELDSHVLDLSKGRRWGGVLAKFSFCNRTPKPRSGLQKGLRVEAPTSLEGWRDGRTDAMDGHLKAILHVPFLDFFYSVG